LGFVQRQRVKTLILFNMLSCLCVMCNYYHQDIIWFLFVFDNTTSAKLNFNIIELEKYNNGINLTSRSNKARRFFYCISWCDGFQIVFRLLKILRRYLRYWTKASYNNQRKIISSIIMKNCNCSHFIVSQCHKMLKSYVGT